MTLPRPKRILKDWLESDAFYGVGVIVLALMFLSRAKPAIGYSLALLVVLGAAGMFGMKYFNGVPLRKDKRTAVQLTMPDSELPKEHLFNPHGVIFFLSVGLAVCLVSGHVVGMAGRKNRAESVA